MEEQIQKSFVESGYFNVVSTGDGAMHMIVDISMDRYVSRSLQFFSTITLGVIPFTGEEMITMDAKVYDEQGSLLGTFQ